MSCPEKVGNKWVALFLRADVPNSNNRLYPRFVLEKNVNNLKSVISSRCVNWTAWYAKRLHNSF